MNKINFQNGTLVSKAKVTVGGTVYEVEPAEYEGTTPLNAENLNQMQTNAENAINTVQSNLNTTNQNITDSNTYSTTEEKVVGTWIDGRPIYRKVIIKNITTNDFVSFAHNIENVDKCWLSGDSFLDVGGTSLPLNYFRYGTNNNIYAHASTTDVSIKIESVGWKNNNAYFIINYTKTTD